MERKEQMSGFILSILRDASLGEIGLCPLISVRRLTEIFADDTEDSGSRGIVRRSLLKIMNEAPNLEVRSLAKTALQKADATSVSKVSSLLTPALAG
jgi:hypothetical protein